MTTQLTDEERRQRQEAADLVLYADYRNHGLDYCKKKSGIDRDYLRWRVAYLKLRISPRAMKRIRKAAQDKRKEAGYKPRAKPKPKERKVPIPPGIKPAELVMSKLERLALGIK